MDCHPKRGKEAFDDLGVLPFFSGVLISDGWKSYWSYSAVEHALCCAHDAEPAIMRNGPSGSRFGLAPAGYVPTRAVIESA